MLCSSIQFCTVWVQLCLKGRQIHPGGALSVGSHRREYSLRLRQWRWPSTAQNMEKRLRPAEGVGDAILFDAVLFHAGPATSTERIGLLFAMIKADISKEVFPVALALDPRMINQGWFWFTPMPGESTDSRNTQNINPLAICDPVPPTGRGPRCRSQCGERSSAVIKRVHFFIHQRFHHCRNPFFFVGG